MPYYVLDGTNLCRLNSRKSLLPLLYVVQHLLSLGHEHDFMCYFDANTHDDHLDQTFDRRVYRMITANPYASPDTKRGTWGVVCEDHFQQVQPGTRADDAVLRLAHQDKTHVVISNDLYRKEAGQVDLAWGATDRQQRLWTVDLYKDTLRLVDASGAILHQVSMVQEQAELALNVINEIERRADRLHGRIYKLYSQQQAGWIQRPYYTSAEIYFIKDHLDESIDFLTSPGLSVAFRLAFHMSGPQKPNLQAQAIVPQADPQVRLEALQRLQADLQAAYQQLEAERDDLHSQWLDACQQVADLQASPSAQERIETLEADKARLTEEVAALEARVRELEALLADSRNQQEATEQQAEAWRGQVIFVQGKLAEAEDRINLVGEGADGHLTALQQDFDHLSSQYQRQRREMLILQAQQTAFTSHPLADTIAQLRQKVEQLEAQNQALQEQMNSYLGQAESFAYQDRQPEPAALSRETQASVEIEQPVADARALYMVQAWWSHLLPEWQENFSTLFFQRIKTSLSQDDLKLVYQHWNHHALNLCGPNVFNVNPLPHCVTHIDPGISVFSQLKVLNLALHQIEDLTPLASLGKLEELLVTGNPLRSLRPLDALTQLRKLEVRNVPLPAEEWRWLATRFPDLELLR